MVLLMNAGVSAEGVRTAEMLDVDSVSFIHFDKDFRPDLHFDQVNITELGKGFSSGYRWLL